MFKFNELRSIHIELTSNCQASCPMCARNNHGGLPNPYLNLKEWTLDDLKSILSQEVLDTVDRLYFCGNFGDPMLHNDLIEMCKHLSQTKPELHIGIHTNGGARKPEWWAALAKALPTSHCVHFGIDGLEDTHHLYRVGTKYETVIKNAKAFIDAGGRAEWTFIKFKHNEHQAEECRRRATELGFEKFMLKNSSRFLIEPKYDVVDKTGTTTHIIEPPTDTVVKFMPKSVIDSYKKVVAEAKVDCYVQGIKEIYIDAYKTIMPCCWVSSIPYTYYDPNHVNNDVSGAMKSQYDKLVSEFGGIEQLNASNGIKNVVESETWQTIWERKWTTDKLITCARVCGKFETVDFGQPNDQFIQSDTL